MSRGLGDVYKRQLFALGAGLGAQCMALLGLRTIWLSCALLCVSLCLMFRKDTSRPAETY